MQGRRRKNSGFKRKKCPIHSRLSLPNFNELRHPLCTKMNKPSADHFPHFLSTFPHACVRPSVRFEQRRDHPIPLPSKFLDSKTQKRKISFPPNFLTVCPQNTSERHDARNVPKSPDRKFGVKQSSPFLERAFSRSRAQEISLANERAKPDPFLIYVRSLHLVHPRHSCPFVR